LPDIKKNVGEAAFSLASPSPRLRPAKAAPKAFARHGGQVEQAAGPSGSAKPDWFDARPRINRINHHYANCSIKAIVTTVGSGCCATAG
jgi:hypothetical protein